MVLDNLVTQGARESAAMVSNLLYHNIPASAPEGFSTRRVYKMWYPYNMVQYNMVSYTAQYSSVG